MQTKGFAFFIYAHICAKRGCARKFILLVHSREHAIRRGRLQLVRIQQQRPGELRGYVGAGPMTIYNSSFSYERSSSGSCVLDLIGKDFETDYESSNSATITLPIPGFAITIDIEQVIDLTEKIWDSIWN